jgi:hypothetical protein
MVLACGRLGPALVPAPLPPQAPVAIAADAPILSEDIEEEETRRRRWPWIVAGLLILAAVALAAWLCLDAAALPTLIAWWETLV